MGTDANGGQCKQEALDLNPTHMEERQQTEDIATQPAIPHIREAES